MGLFSKEQLKFLVTNKYLLKKILITGKLESLTCGDSKYHEKREVIDLYLKCRTVLNEEIMQYTVFKDTAKMHLTKYGEEVLGEL